MRMYGWANMRVRPLCSLLGSGDSQDLFTA